MHIIAIHFMHWITMQNKSNPYTLSNLIIIQYSKNCYGRPLWSVTTCDSRPPIEGTDAFSTLKDL
jgi:hypothetical protein